MADGILNIRKDSAIRSFSIIEELKTIPGVEKAGYAGTLDNFASGVLLCGVNKATRILKYLLSLDKEYEAVVILGRTTDTLDPQGSVTATGRTDYSKGEIAEAAAGFVGAYSQTPPDFSSKKIEGRRASDLAREGKTVNLAPAGVTIHSLTVGDTDTSGRFTMKVRCSTGTYIRALARDIGLKLGTVAMLDKLERTSNGRFKAVDGLRPGEIDMSRHLVSMRDSLYFLEEAHLRPEAAGKVKNGVPLDPTDLISVNLKNGAYRLIFNELLLSVIERRDGRFLYLDNFSTDI